MGPANPTRGLWLERAPSSVSDAVVPDRVDVCVVGAGISGLAAAMFLARRGARVAVLERRSEVGGGASGRTPGVGFLGSTEHPWRLVHSLGNEQATSLFAFCRDSLELSAQLGCLEQTSGVWVAADERESDDVTRSVAALRAIGVEAQALSRMEVVELLGSRAFGAGFRVPVEGLADPAAAARELARSARLAGASVHLSTPVHRVTDGANGVIVHVPDHEIACEAIVFAAGAELPALHPYFAERLYPYREQALATAPLGPKFSVGFRTQSGYVTWRQAATGEIVVSGCRWATPHLEEGETEEKLVTSIQTKLEQFLTARFPELGPIEVAHRWCWIDAKSCDGLPLIGPIPGSARWIACTGFDGNHLGFGLSAGKTVAEGLLGTAAEPPPRLFSPSRMV